MGRIKTGSVSRFVDEKGRVRYKLASRCRTVRPARKRLPPGTTEARARATADSWNEKAQIDPDFQPVKQQPEGEALGDWYDRWFGDRDARGIQTKVDRGRVRKHVPADLMRKPIVSIAKEDLEGIVETLDRQVAAREMKWKNAANIWGIISKSFDDAAHSKTRALRARLDNAAADVRGPDRGAKTLKQYLYPDEFRTFILSDAVPLDWRVFVAVATYLYTRPGELEALEWGDIDLDRGTVHVHRAIDYEHGGIKATKTETPRKFVMEPALQPLLHALRDRYDGTGRLFPELPYRTNGARDFRRLLLKAGVTREELHAADDTRQAITFRDTRATGITWRAVRGDDPLKIKSCAGHKRFSTTEIYIREAEAIRDSFGDAFPALTTLANLAANSPQPAKSTRSLWSRRGSNPLPPACHAGALPNELRPRFCVCGGVAWIGGRKLGAQGGFVKRQRTLWREKR